jgi:small subunit ribosomal protein S18
MKIDYISYKDLETLKYGVSERFKIMPRRLTGTCKKHQEQLSNAVKRARAAALIPYIVDRKNVVESPFDKIKPLHNK